MLFFYKFFTFSQHSNKFYYRKFQNHSQIPIHGTNHGQIQHHTPPKLQFNPQQQTPAIKSHNHQNTTTTPPQQQQKSKSQREISGSKVRSRGDEIELRRDRAAQCCGLRNARCDRCGAIGKIWCVRSSDWSSGFAGDVEGVIWASSPPSRALSLSLSLSLSLCTSNSKMV